MKHLIAFVKFTALRKLYLCNNETKKMGHYSNLEKLADTLLRELQLKINIEAQKVQSSMPYKAQYVAEKTIEKLQRVV